MSEVLNNRYELLDRIGQGSMGEVWRAYDTHLQRHVALKRLRLSSGIDAAGARERFSQEARAAGRLTHSNIVAVHDVARDGDGMLIAMELLSGVTLDQLLRDSGTLSSALTRAIMSQVAHALAAAHEASVVHRDLKPANIFWTDDDRAVVVDFGLARIGVGVETVEGIVMGTPGYMSPEQIQGLVAGPPSDVFSWGAVAYELISGLPPFGDPDEVDFASLGYRVVHEDVRPISIPADPALAHLINRSLSRDPDRRPADGAALVTDLMAHAPLGDGDAAPKGPPAPSDRRGGQLWVITACVVAAVVVAVGAFALAMGRGRPDAASGSEHATTVPTVPSTATTTTTTAPVPAWQDDFRAPETTWPTDRPNGTFALFAPTVFEHYYQATWQGPEPLFAEAPAGATYNAPSLRVEVDAITADATDSGLRFGLFCRERYYATIGVDGSWAIARYAPGAPSRDIRAGVPGTGSRLTPGPQHLQLDCRDVAGAAGASSVQLRFSVNGLLLGEVTDQPALTRSKAGVAVLAGPAGATVLFDNFGLEAIP